MISRAEVRRPLAVIAFNGEEEGLLGSNEFVRTHASLRDRYGIELVSRVRSARDK